MREKRLPFDEWADAYVRITNSARRPSVSTMRRWYRHGLKDGTRLEIQRLVGGVHTTESALRLFCELRDIPKKPKPKIVDPQRRFECNADAAIAKLKAMGIG